MPDFNNLNPILINPDQKLPNLPSPSNATPNNLIPLGTDLSGRDNGHPIFGKGPELGKDLLPTVTAGELYQNRRYDIFDRSIIDIEDQNANAQSVLSKATNGVLKGLNLAGTTVAGSFGMLYGAAKSPFSGRLADIWDNPVMQKLDEWNTEVDQNYLPNYYTNQEKNAAWYSTDNWMKANFLFDKLIKNSGFAVGAMLSGNIANAGLKAAGALIGEAAMAGSVAAESSQAFKIFTPLLRNTARAFSAGKNIEAAAILENGISSIAEVEATASQMAKIAQTTNKIAGFSEKARRTAVAVYSSSGESAFEALQTSNEYRNNLIAKYKEEHLGQDPEGAELENINTISESVGKTSFLGNLALLSVTEYVQLPKLLGSSYAAEKQAANSLLGTADNVLLKEGKYVAAAGATTRFGKIYEKAAKIGKYVFDPKEAGQELGQFALQVGTQNYFNKAYKGQEADAWTDGFLYGMVGKNEKGEGVGALVSKEGMESAILGGLTGGGMQAIANYGNDARVKSNTAKFIEQLNGAPSARDAFKERLDAVNRGVALQEEEQQAILQGEQLEARDLKRDQMHNYLAPRIKYGRFDMIMDDINELRQNGMTEDGLAQLKEQGIANINDTVQSFQKRLTNFEQTAKNTNELYKSFDLRFSGETLKDADGKALLTPDGKQIRKYSPLLIDKMVYAASKVADYDVRIPQVSVDLITNGIDAQGVINDVLTNDASTLLPKTLNEIDETSNSIIKDKLKEDLKDSVELAARRKFFLAEYEAMKNNPQNYDYTGEKEEFTPEGKKTRTTTPDMSDSQYFGKSRDKFKSDNRTYADLVNQYGEGERSKYDVLKKIVESPYATVLEKRLASEFLKYTPKDSKIILGDRTLSTPGRSTTGVDKDSSLSRINYEDTAHDYESGSIPIEFILLHEIGHDLTAYALRDESGQFFKELDPLFKFVQETFKNDPNKYAEAGLIKDGEYYAFKNIREFATEALSNREFQRYLQTIPYAKTQTSVWDTFIDSLKTFFRRLFGTESDTALDEVVAVVTNNIDSLYKNVKERNEKLEEEEKTLLKNRTQLTKEQNNLEKQSGTIATIPTTNVTSPDEPPLKDEAKLFTSGTTESEGYSDPTNSAPHVKRSREFLNNAKTFKNRGKMKAILVTPNQEDSLGLTGLAKLSYGENDMSDSTNVETGLVVQVFVIQERGKNYFVDKNGNKLTEVGKQVDLNEVIFQTMPTTKLYNSKGNPRFRSNQAAEAKIKSKAWSIYREQLFNAPAGSFPIFDFQISRGIPIENAVGGVKEKNQVGEVLIPEIKISTQQGLITIPTTGSVSHNGESLKFPNGVPVLQYGDTVQFLNNRKFNDREANGIFQVIKNLAEDVVDQSNNKKTIKLNAGYAAFLQNVLYWRAGEITSDNQIRINVDTMSFQLGKKEFALTEIASNEKEIVAALKETFNNVNNNSLTKNFSKPFVEYYINENGEFTTSEWDNYQAYLLSSTYPSGGKRSVGDTPLTTSVAKPTAEIPYSFKQKYATLEGLELPVQSVVAEEAPAAEETEDDVIGGYKLNNEVVNTYPLQNGDVDFKGSIDADGNVSVTVLDNDTIKTIADNKKLVNDAIVPALKAANRFNATADDAQLVLDYVALRISADLQTQKDAVKQAAPKAEEGVQPIAPPEVVAQQELEAKKADIEKRKQEEISQLDKSNKTFSESEINKASSNEVSTLKEVQNSDIIKQAKIDQDLHDAVQGTDRFSEKDKKFLEEDKKLKQRFIDLIEGKNVSEEEINDVIKGLTKDKAIHGQYLKMPENENTGSYTWHNHWVSVYDGWLGKLNELKDINAKYDAELAALEGTKPTTSTTGIEKRINDTISAVFGSESLFDFSENQPGTVVEGEFIPDNLGSQIFEAMNKTLRGEVVPTNKAEAAKLFKEYAKVVHPDMNVQSPEAQIIAEGFFKAMQTAKEKGRVDILNELKRKFDEELTALESGKTPEKPYNPRNTTGPSTNFRKVGVADSKERISDVELQLFKEWHAQNIPNIPYEVLENLITDVNGEKNWGVFEEGVAKFFKDGLRGTEYHEIGEAIWKGMLSPEERQAILDDERLKAGTFVDRESGKTYSYDDPKVSDQMLKERIMDDFSDYRLGKLPARSLGERVRRFFKSIMDFFKSFVAKPSLKEDLFKAIDTGKFKERTLRESVKNEAAEYRAVAGLTEQQTHEFVQDMTARAAGILYSESKKNLLFSPDAITSGEMFGKIEQMYAAEGKMEELGPKAWTELKQKTKENLRTLGINFDNDDIISINDENANKNDYAPEPFSTDWKKNSTGAIKFSLATLLETSANNQENSLQLELPQAKESSIRGYRLLNFSRAFATVLDKLANTTSVSTAMDKLLNLANYDSNYVRLWSRVGGSKNKTVPFETFDNTDWRYFIQFMQTFTKQKPDALVQYKSGSEVYTAPANLYTAIKETQRSWVENIKTIAQGSDTLINYDKASKNYKINIEKIKEFPIKTPQNMVEFLSNIGVEFSLDVYNSLKTNERNRFAKAVSAIYTYIGENNDIMTVTNETLGINSQLSTLAELLNKVTNPNQDSTYFGVEGQRMGSFSENNAPSVFENEFNEADTLDELLEKRPELNDMFSANSQILKKGGLFFDKEGNRIKSMKVKYIQGTKNLDNNKGFTSSKLGIGERFTQEINQNLNGDYYVLIPADGSTEWMMELGNPILFSDIDANRAWSKINKVFKGYLMDDVALALDADNRKQLKNVGSKAKELRFFKDILAQEDLEAINEMINDDATQEQIEEYINENIGRINDYIKAYIDSTITETRKTLVDNNQIIQFEEDAFSYVGLDDEFMKSEKLNKFNLSDQSINNILTFANVNYIINNIEYHKVLFGDPYQFKIKNGQLDETKRIKSFLSPRRTTFDTPEYNTFLNQEMNSVDGIQLNPGDPGYHQYKAYTNTLTVKDVTIAGSLSNIIGAYSETNEADAMSWLMDNTYKEIKMKNGQWSDEAEAWHQWQMAWTRQNLPGYEYSSTELESKDKELTSKEAPKHTIEVLKPIVSGNKFNKNQFDLVLDKFSQMPIYYSMVKGTNLEKLYVQMMNQGYGYAIVESGRKVGAEKLHSLYNTDGSFNEQAFDNNIQVPWKAYGIQVETTTEGEKTQTRGSQLTKLSSIDLFDNGVATSEAARKEYIRNTSILNNLHENAYNTLLTRLGVVDLDNGFALEDGTAVSETLMYEMMRRELSDNAKDTIQLDENNQFRIPFEASPSYSQIRSILYSMVNKSFISPTMNGGAHVQVPATMFESLGENRSLAIKTAEGWKKISKDEYEKLSDDEKKSVVLTDDSLKFYSKESPYCEVMLPHWFKEKFANKFKTDKELLKYLNNTQEGRSILTGIGFRIPTQAMSSIEVFKVKGFLPQYMGATVVVPSEITTKAGSDFDIDKLNMYLKSVYADRTGAIKLVKYQGSEEATKEFFGKVFDDTLAVKQMKKVELIEAVDILVQGLEDPKGLVNKYGDYIKSVQDQYDNPYDFRSIVEKKLNKLTDSNLQSELRNDYVNDMYKKSLENEYYDSLEKLMTLPENFSRLISPVDDAGLKDLASRLNTLRGYDETGIKNRILDRNYMTKLRNAFVTAKKWVGIAAVNITNLSLKQKSKIYINPERFESIDEYDRILLGDGKIVLKHNTVDVNGRKYISLSGSKVKDSEELISNRLSGYATSFVDVAKDPYILDIIQSNLVIGTFMFLENVGAGEQAALFLNQPIISEYLKMLDGKGSKNLFKTDDILTIKSKFVAAQSQIDDAQIDVEMLAGNIYSFYEKGYFKSSNDNAVQHVVLDEFLKYAKMAQYAFKFTQATNYDTTKFGSGDELMRKQLRTEIARGKSIISSVDDVLNNTFIGKQERFLSKSTQAMGAILKLEQDSLRLITDDVLRSFAENEYMSADDFNKISNKVKSAFLDYIIQTKTGINDRIKELLVDNATAVVNRLEQAKKDYPNLKILNDFSIVTSDRVDGAKSIKLKVNLKDAYDENLYTGMMRELRDYNDELNSLYKDIIAVAILQGSYQSAISIKNILPIEDYAEVVTPVVEAIVADEDLQAFTKGMFQRNNFSDDTIVPSVAPKFFPASDVPTAQLDSLGNHYADVYMYYSPNFPNVKGLGIKSSERKVLLLSQRYNSFYLKNDFVKVPRVVVDRFTGDSIDMKTGLTITKMDYALMKLKGDPSLKDVYGYAKVKLPNGEPLITSNEKVGDQYVYKLINLYGDGNRATENYKDFRESVIDNGTVKIVDEIPDADLIEFYGGKVEAKDVSLQTETPTQTAEEPKSKNIPDGLPATERSPKKC